MFKKCLTVALGIAVLACLPLTACGTKDKGGNSSAPAKDIFTNPGDKLGGGQEVATPPQSISTQTGIAVKSTVAQINKGGSSPSASATQVTKKIKITEPGDYIISGTVEGKINVKCEGVRLFLQNAHISAEDDKAISSDYGLVINLSGNNSVANTATSSAGYKNAIGCDGALVINGSGSLEVNSTKNAISANSITIAEASITAVAQKDGLHAEIGAYDSATAAPQFSYEDGGFVYLDGADVKLTSDDDGIQADTFVYVTGESKLDILANGGAPATITEAFADVANGKGIKAGTIDWGADNAEIASDNYMILIEGGTVSVNSNDDAIHSNGQIEINGGVLSIASGDDGIHADKLLKITGGDITVKKSYEGVESGKIELSGGVLEVNAIDDGVNAADGTESRPGQANANCYLIVSGGSLIIDAGGDGLDSNGTMLISGGQVCVAGSERGDNAALDSDGGILINGGYVFALGALGMVETPASNSSQCCVSYAHSSTISSGTVITLTDEQDNVLFSYTSSKNCRSVIISCPQLKTGQSYKIYGGDTQLTQFTVSSTITTVGSSEGIGNPGGKPGHGGGFVGGRH